MPAHSLQLPRHLGSITRTTALGGGDTCTSHRVETDTGCWFVKTGAVADDMFTSEAASLAALAATDTVTVPAVEHADAGCLVLAFIEPGVPADDYWESLARDLAALHGTDQSAFGFDCDNYCGRNRQPNPRDDDGWHFFAVQRLGFQADMAQARGLLDGADSDRIDRLCRRLPELVPAQPPSLIHGDLWSGNHFAGADGRPVLVDPAAHCGWAEAELAMMTLFGAPPARFFDAYTDNRPLAPGFRERFDLYNLYHLLNHLNLFGGGYRSSVRAILDRFD